MKFRARKNGFTLLELMIACAVTIVALTGLVSTYISCFELNETGRHANLALNAATKVLEQIRSTPFLSVDSYYNPGGNGYSFQVPLPGMSPDKSMGHVTIDDSNPNLLRVDVTVCWMQKGSRIIGECVTDGSGNLVFQDKNGNGKYDSPVQLTTLVTQR